MDTIVRGIKDGKIKSKEKELGESQKYRIQVKSTHCMYKCAPKEANQSNIAKQLLKTINHESREVRRFQSM